MCGLSLFSIKLCSVLFTKHSKRPVIAKRSLSTKKVLYAIFFSGEGVAIKVPVKKGKSITGKYYKDVVLKKLKKSIICNQFCKGKQSSFLCIGKQLWIHNYFPSLYIYHNYSNYFYIQKTFYGDIFGDNSGIIFSYFSIKKNIFCKYSLEVPCQGALNEYPLHVFMENWKKLSQNDHEILL